MLQIVLLSPLKRSIMYVSILSDNVLVYISYYLQSNCIGIIMDFIGFMLISQLLFNSNTNK